MEKLLTKLPSLIAPIRIIFKKWPKLAESNILWAFLDTLFGAYSQIIFCDNPFIGLLMLVAFIDSPVSGILSLIGSISAIATAMLTRTHISLTKSGLFGINGALTGLALSIYLPMGIPLVILVIVSSIIAAVLVKLLVKALSIKYNLPVLGVPFVAVTLAGLLVARAMPSHFATYANLPHWLLGGRMERLLHPIVPESLVSVFHTSSAVLYQHSIYIGMLCALGIIMYSRIAALSGLAGGAIGVGLYHIFYSVGGDSVRELTVGFNSALIGMALGGIFIVLTWQSAIYTLLAVVIGAFITLAFVNLLDIWNLPALAIGFNLVTILFLFALTRVPDPEEKFCLTPIPLLQVSNPEIHLKRRLAKVTKLKHQQVRLSLPFYGEWYVSCGNSGEPTHTGKYAFAWDFIVLDDKKISRRGISPDAEDYYAFGLPILAPASGNIVKVNNSVHDNVPNKANWEQSWGNYVIIDHGNNEFSEFSHFKQNSIVVKEGDKVVRGQVLGYCGNSGLSIAPHIHFQVQNGSSVGADTIPVTFSNYATRKGSSVTLAERGIPKKGEFVSNSLNLEAETP